MYATLDEKLVSMKAEKGYCEEALNFKGLEDWERKEYSALVNSYDTDIANLELHIKTHNL